jgi:SpoIID/LytB domain protein
MKFKKSPFIFVIAIITIFSLVKENISAPALSRDSDPKEIITAYNNAEFLKAIKYYKKLAEDGDIEGYLNLAMIFKDLGHYERAIEILKRAQRKFNEDSKVLSFLGRLYYLNNQIDEAIAILKRIVELKPDDLDAYINLGLCYAEKGDDSEAQKYYEKVISLNKNSVIARLSLADLYNRREKIPEAIREYKTVGLIDTSIVSIQKILGELFFRMGDFQEALKTYQKIRLIEPGNKLAQERIREITDKIGKEYFQKEQERIALLRKQKMVLAKPFPAIKNIISVRVGLMLEEISLGLKCSTNFEIITKNGKVNVVNGLAGQNYSLTKNIEEKIIIIGKDNEKVIVDEPILIKPLKPEGTITLFDVKFGKNNFWSGQQDRSYRGLIEISADTSGINVINIVNLEEYLYSVLPSEMPANWPKEALKAQAIAARSEAMRKLSRHKDAGFDFCPEVHCQAYAGVEQETELTNKAVDETRGFIMVYQGGPMDAVYSSNCGGHTQDNIFGNGQDIPYLKARQDTLENNNLTFPLSPIELEYWLKEPRKGMLCDGSEYSKNSNFRWVRIYAVDEIKEMLSRIADFGEIRKIIAVKRNKSGHISAIKIIGINISYTLEKELNIRNSLSNLRSSMFKIEIKYGPDKKPQQFIFYGGGWGHGVGMCQSGAKGMANLGKNYKEILNHYYQGIEFKKAY